MRREPRFVANRPSPLCFVTDLAEQLANPLDVVPLQFQVVAVERPAGAADRFEFRQQRRQIVLRRGQATDDGHLFPALAIFQGQPGRLLLRGLESRRPRRRGRALTIRLQLPTPFALRRQIPFRPGENSHATLFLGAVFRPELGRPILRTVPAHRS